MIDNVYYFGNLSASDLLPCLIKELNSLIDSKKEQSWQVCWLNNDGKPVIGLLPKTTWTVWPIHNHERFKHKPTKIKVTIATRTPLSLSASQPLKLRLQCSDLMEGETAFHRLAFHKLTFQPLSLCQTTSNLLTSYEQWVETLIKYSNQHLSIQSHPKIASPHHSPAYQNGLIGFIDYDLAASHISPNININALKQPSAFLGHYDVYLSLNTNQKWQLYGQTETDPNIIATVDHYLKQVDAKISGLTNSSSHEQVSENPQLIQHDRYYPLSKHTTHSLTLAPSWCKTQYQSAFKKVQDYLYQGDSYQINLTQQWRGELDLSRHKKTRNDSQSAMDSDSKNIPNHASLVNYLPRLHQNTQAPFAGYLRIDPTCEAMMSNLKSQTPIFELLSCSPELFTVFDKDEEGNHQISTKPIKGTRPRGNTLQRDQQLKKELENSEKDRAENVMIVDLLRNDLGKYAKTGSVKVPKLFAIESFSNVHHMVSTVTATIKKDIHPLSVLFDSLPAGSITGAPKKRAIEIINELEADARGAYCGSMGFMNFDGTGQWNVLIRTLQAISNEDKLEVTLWAGGGITVGSECEAEYKECFDKVGNLLDVLAKS